MTLPKKTRLKKIIVGVVLAAAFAGNAFWWHAAHRAEKEISAIPSTTAYPAMPTSATPASMPAQKIDSVDVMTERLRARLEKEPNDVNGWVLLARSYHYLERWDDAKAAFAKARALGYQGEGEAESTNESAAVMSSTPSNTGDAVFTEIGRITVAKKTTVKNQE